MKKQLYRLATDQVSGVVPAFFKGILFILSLMYGACVRCMLWCYQQKIFRQHALGRAVVSVGNITLGGTGKTPLVDFIVKFLRRSGCKVGIVTRGYKRKPGTLGDEPSLLQRNNPDVSIGVGADRVRCARELIERRGIDAIVLDDGFQQWRLKKDLEIVTIDAGLPFGNRRLIPRGILREPLSSLQRADVFVITKSDSVASLGTLKDELKTLNPTALIVESVYGLSSLYPLSSYDNPQAIAVSSIAKSDVCLLCSIANPGYFEKMVRDAQAKPAAAFYFMDHYACTMNDIRKVFSACENKGIRTIITTEKDAVRLRELPLSSEDAGRILVSKIEFTITRNEETFCKRLSDSIRR